MSSSPPHRRPSNGLSLVGTAAPPPRRWPWPPLVRANVGLHAAAGVTAAVAPETLHWALGTLALSHATLGAAGLWPRSRWLGPNVTQLPPGPMPHYALTLDDGPDPEVTPAVLDMLAALDARATFFVIAEQAQRHPQLVRRIVEAGHDVQNHSLRHRHSFSLSTSRAFEREIGTAQQVLADLTGRRPHCFRAPAGLRNPMLDPVLHKLDLHLVSWTRRAFDTREPRADVVLQRLTRGLADGDILLLHDGHARRNDDGAPTVLQVLPQLIARCRDAGLTPVTLADALPPRHRCAP